MSLAHEIYSLIQHVLCPLSGGVAGNRERTESHSGDCDEDTRELSKVPAIAEQLASIDSSVLSSELNELGAWDSEELADHQQNLQRILWLAAHDIAERDGCDCGERGDMERGELRYFNANVENFKGETADLIRQCVRRDYERMERLNRGDWCYIGIRAEQRFSFPRVTRVSCKKLRPAGCGESKAIRTRIVSPESKQRNSPSCGLNCRQLAFQRARLAGLSRMPRVRTSRPKRALVALLSVMRTPKRPQDRCMRLIAGG